MNLSSSAEIGLNALISRTPNRLNSVALKQISDSKVYDAIDDLAILSARSMQIRTPLTSVNKLINSNNILYLIWDEVKNANCLIGFLKIGHKQLFLYDNQMKTYQGCFVALLDFYIHFTHQRQGYGKKLFDFMLEKENILVYQLAFDNPSETLLTFLTKNYNLMAPIWQNTNFVVFPDLFKENMNGSASSVLDGWNRQTPQQIGTISLASPSGDGQKKTMDYMSTESSAAGRSNEARLRKVHILSSNPLW